MIYAFVGKGGVGKTTISSAFALEISSPEKKTCLISMDFMPMTHYIFNKKEKYLDVIEYTEFDAQKEWRKKYGNEVYRLITSFFSIDESIIDHIEKAPGIADEFIYSKLLDLKNEYDYIVWDTAASSSTLHLLITEMEFYEHINRDIKFYLSIKETLNRIRKSDYDPLEILEKWKALAKNVWNLLKNETTFFIVETDDELSFLQGQEIAHELKEMGLHIDSHIINRSRNIHYADYKIPEFSGNSREIVEKIRPYVREILQEK